MRTQALQARGTKEPAYRGDHSAGVSNMVGAGQGLPQDHHGTDPENGLGRKMTGRAGEG